jgi:YVTN family beta-propeller protein
MNSLYGSLPLVAAAYACLTLPGLAEDRQVADLRVEGQVAKQSGSSVSMAFDHDALWLAQGGKKVLRVNPHDYAIDEIVIPDASSRQREIGVGEGAVWVPDVGSGMIFKIDPQRLEVVGRFPVAMTSTQATIAAGGGSIWVVTDQKLETVLARLDAVTGAQEALIELPTAGTGVVFGYDQVWVSSPPANDVYRIDPAINKVSATIQVGESPRFMVAGGDAIWVLNAGAGTVSRIEAATNTVRAEIDIGFPSTTGEIAFGGDRVWTSVPYKAMLIAIDPRDNKVTRFLGRGSRGYVTFGSDSVWVWGQNVLRLTPP